MRWPWLIILVATSSWAGTTWYVSSNAGLDSVDGGFSLALPFRTLTYAATRLQSGDELVLDDGTFNEHLVKTCTPDAGPSDVYVHARNERRAALRTVTLQGCSGWKIEGLRLKGGADSAIRVGDQCRKIVVRRNLITHDGTAGIGNIYVEVKGSSHLIEENEFLGLQRLGLYLYADDSVARRNYFRGNDAPVGNGNVPLEVLGSRCIAENNVSEHTTYGMNAVEPARDALLVGNLERDLGSGVYMSSISAPVGPLRYVDHLLLGVSSTGAGYYARHALGVSVERSTVEIAGPTATCFNADDNQIDAGNLTMKVIAGECQGRSFASFHDQLLAGVYDSIWFTDAGTTVDPIYVQASTVSPREVTRANTGRQGCWAYPPVGTALDLPDGGYRGARVIYRTENGVLTKSLLWGPEFPCGETIPGLNDLPGCKDVHTRFGVNLPACPLPRESAAPAFASVPSREATCGQPWVYAPKLDSQLPVTLSFSSDAGLTFDGTRVRWENPSGTGEGTLTANSAAGSSAQHFKVEVNCPPTGCGCQSGSAGLGALGFACWLLRRRRV